MTAFFTFCAAVGVPLVLWFAFSGGDSEGLGGDVDADGGDSVFSVIPLSTVAFFFAFVGVGGLLAQATGLATAGALIVAIGAGLVAAVVNTSMFRYLRRTESSSDLTQRDFEGRIGRVALPLSKEHRGQIVVDIAGQPAQLTATPMDGEEIEIGARVMVVGVDRGIARVTRLAPELDD